MSENNNSEKFNPTTYKNKFQKEKYDRIIVNVPKGEKEPLKKHAEEHGYKSLNDFIVFATREQMKRDTATAE